MHFLYLLFGQLLRLIGRIQSLKQSFQQDEYDDLSLYSLIKSYSKTYQNEGLKLRFSLQDKF